MAILDWSEKISKLTPMPQLAVRHADLGIIRGPGGQERGNMTLQHLFEEALLASFDHRKLPNVFHLQTKPAQFHKSPDVFEELGKRLDLKSPDELPEITLVSTSKELMLKLIRFRSLEQYSLALTIWSNMQNATSVEPLEIEFEDGRTVLATQVAGKELITIHLS